MPGAGWVPCSAACSLRQYSLAAGLDALRRASLRPTRHLPGCVERGVVAALAQPQSAVIKEQLASLCQKHAPERVGQAEKVSSDPACARPADTPCAEPVDTPRAEPADEPVGAHDDDSADAAAAEAPTVCTQLREAGSAVAEAETSVALALQMDESEDVCGSVDAARMDTEMDAALADERQAEAEAEVASAATAGDAGAEAVAPSARAGAGTPGLFADVAVCEDTQTPDVSCRQPPAQRQGGAVRVRVGRPAPAYGATRTALPAAPTKPHWRSPTGRSSGS